MALSASLLEDLGVGTPEGPTRIVSEEVFANLQDISNNERHRILDALQTHDTEDAAQIQELYGIVQ